MTCEEFDVATSMDPLDATVAMRAAVTAHYITCAKCRDFLTMIARLAKLRVPPDETARAVRPLMEDPEAVAVMLSAVESLTYEERVELADHINQRILE